MEPHKDASNTSSKLAALPVEILEQIIWFSGPNASLRLIECGERLFNVKVRRTKVLSLRWESSAYYDWDRCSVIWNAFPNLTSLRLSTFLPTLLGNTQWRRGCFPKQLIHLSVHFSDAFALLNPEYDMLSNLTLLQSLYAYCQPPKHATHLTIRDLPECLRILRLGIEESLPSSTKFVYDLADASSFPEYLETVHIEPFSVQKELLANNPRRSNIQPLQVSLRSPCITNLSLRTVSPQDFDLSAIAAQLTRLELDFHEPSPFELSPSSTFRSDFPNLQAIKTRFSQPFVWSHLRYLPPLITELSTNFDEFLDAPAETDADLAAMNDEYSRHGYDIGYPAPMNLLLVTSISRAKKFLAPSHLRHFLHLANASSVLTSFVSLDEAPQGDDRLNLNTLDFGALSRLPQRLQSLNTEFQVSQHDLPLPGTLTPHLTSLTCGELPLELIPLLPRSLQSLTLCVSDMQPLYLITRRANEGTLAELRTMNVSCPLVPNSSVYRPLELSAATIPNTMTSLVIDKAQVQISTHLPSSIRQLLALVDLRIEQPVDGLKLIRHLPRSLKRLEATFTSPLDLANVADCVEFCSFKHQVPRLKTLIIRKQFIRPLTPSNKPQNLSLARFFSLPAPLRRLYAEVFFRTLNHRLASEKFAFSCLPRELSELSLADWNAQMQHLDRLSESYLNDAWDLFLRPALMYSFPILGLRLSDHEDKPFGTWTKVAETFGNALPPYLSNVSFVGGSDNIQASVYMRATGRWPNGHKYKRMLWPSSAECALHVSNIAMLLLIPLIMPITWSTTQWLRAYFWSTMLGSAIGLPLAIRRYRRSCAVGLIEPAVPTPWKYIALRFSATAVASSVSGLLIGATAVTWTGNYNVLARGATLVATLVYTYLRNGAVRRA